jgi:hypothetical protein
LPNGNNPGTYLYYPGRFTSIFPNGLVIGCISGNTLKLTSAQAVTNFLPSGTAPRALPRGILVNPTKATYVNVFAGQLVALTLNLKFDSADVTFASSSNHLKDLYITKGNFAGWKVGKFLEEANKRIGGCATDSYSFAVFNATADSINSAFDNGYRKSLFLSCEPPVTRLVSAKSNKVATENQTQLQVFPNPAKGEAWINLDGKMGEKVTITLMDNTGRILQKNQWVLGKTGMNRKNISLLNLRERMILIRVESDKKTMTTQLLLEQ